MIGGMQYPVPQIGLANSMPGQNGGSYQDPNIQPVQQAGGAGGGWQQMLMGALQNPQIQQLLMGQGQQQAPMMQPPGLLMPQHQIPQFQMEPLKGLGGLLGGGHGRR